MNGAPSRSNQVTREALIFKQTENDEKIGYAPNPLTCNRKPVNRRFAHDTTVVVTTVAVALSL